MRQRIYDQTPQAEAQKSSPGTRHGLGFVGHADLWLEVRPIDRVQGIISREGPKTVPTFVREGTRMSAKGSLSTCVEQRHKKGERFRCLIDSVSRSAN